MNGPTAIDEATRRLREALDSLESALEQRMEADRSRAALAGQIYAFETDRARLAAELDETVARTRRLESSNRDVAAQLDEAIDGIRAIIAACDR